MLFIKKCLRTVSRALLFLRSNDLHDLLPLREGGKLFSAFFEEENGRIKANYKEECHMTKANFGVVGMAVMGRNLALNIESRGYTVAIFNRSKEKQKM